MLFECMVGKGKLTVTSFDLSDKAATQQPVTAALRKSVLHYMASPKCKPQNKITMEELEAWMPARYVAPVILASPPAINDVADPGQVKQ
jgi:hypothetical protein